MLFKFVNETLNCKVGEHMRKKHHPNICIYSTFLEEMFVIFQ